MPVLNNSIYKQVTRLKVFTKIWLFLLIWPLIVGMTLPFQAAVPKEYQIKAVFLFNFTQFVEWPPEAFSEAKAPIIIGIWGGNPFGTYLTETLKGEKVNGRSLLVRSYRTIEDIRNCHILFLNSHPGDRSEQVLTGLKGKSILTVSDAANFIQQGGMVRFFNENNKIRIQINPDMTKSANLTISSSLLRLAETVTPNN